MEILNVHDLCKTYGKGEAKVDALKNVSFSLEKGEFAAVLGESGSGKSTLLNCIGALDAPSSGHILVDGQDLFSMKEEQRTIFRRRIYIPVLSARLRVKCRAKYHVPAPSGLPQA